MSKIAVVLPLLLLCACSPSHTIKTANGDVTVTEKGHDGESAIHVTGKDGAMMDFNSGKTITDYPSDTPLYEGKSMMDARSAEKHSRVLSLQTPDPMEKITDFYKSQIEGKGWKLDSTMTTPQMNMFVATKENRKLSVMIATDPTSKMQTITQTLADK